MQFLDSTRWMGLALLTAAGMAATAEGQAGWVLSEQKISATEGGFGGSLRSGDSLGRSVASLGDLDGDGVGDVAVGAPGDSQGGLARGALWVVFLRADGTVKGQQKINDLVGGFGGVLYNTHRFGSSVASLGDLDGDGVCDVAVGAPGDSLFGWSRGAVWILFLRSDGTVKTFQKIQDFTGGFGGVLRDWDGFGTSLGAGDLDSNGTTELFVGAPGDRGASSWAGAFRGAVWTLFLNADGTVFMEQEISETEGGFEGYIRNGDRFGSSVAHLGDIDSDGTSEIAVGAIGNDHGGSDAGAVWILSLDTGGIVCSYQRICNYRGGIDEKVFEVEDHFGQSVARLADQDGDGVVDLAVGAPDDDDGSPPGSDRGAVWILFLSEDRTVRALQKISMEDGGLQGILQGDGRFGSGLASLGDHDGDGFEDLVVGEEKCFDGGIGRRGAVWNLLLQGCPIASATSRNPDVGGFTNPAAYDVTDPPILGVGLGVSITTTGKTGSFLVGYSTPTTLSTSWGNLLVDVTDPNGELLGSPSDSGDPTVIWTSIPDEPVLCGFTCSTQAIRFGGGFDLTNAQDLVLGR